MHSGEQIKITLHYISLVPDGSMPANSLHLQAGLVLIKSSVLLELSDITESENRTNKKQKSEINATKVKKKQQVLR